MYEKHPVQVYSWCSKVVVIHVSDCYYLQPLSGEGLKHSVRNKLLQTQGTAPERQEVQEHLSSGIAGSRVSKGISAVSLCLWASFLLVAVCSGR